MQRTLLVIKPDAVSRGLVGRIIARVQEKGLALRALKLLRLDRQRAERFYEVHRGQPFFEPLVAFMTSGPVAAAVFEGRRAIAVVRRLVGGTDGAAAAPGTIRGDWALSNRYNLVHASDSEEAYRRELPVLLAADDIIEGAAPGSLITFEGEA